MVLARGGRFTVLSSRIVSLEEQPSALASPEAHWPINAGRAKSRLRYFWRQVIQLRATPHRVALGFAIGVFTACTPFLGVQTVLACLLAFLLRVSMPAALLGTFIGNPLSWPAIWSAS